MKTKDYNGILVSAGLYLVLSIVSKLAHDGMSINTSVHLEMYGPELDIPVVNNQA